MKVGDLLRNIDTGEERFRVVDLLAEGRSFYIAEGVDTHLDDLRVVLKAIKYSDEPTVETIRQRREALREEVEALTIPSVLLPEPLDFFEVEADLDLGEPREPVLVLEHQSGKTLRQEVERAGGGMEAQRALKLTHELALALEAIHEAGFVYRDLNPDHVIVGIDDIIHLVGTGNMIRQRQRPKLAKEAISERYSAPEIRAEISGKFLLPVADVYSLGALLAFMLTGIDPSPNVESPLSPEAYAKLQQLPEGYGLILGRCLRPMAKHRVKRLSQLAPFLAPQTLPTREVKMFASASLPEPFDPTGSAVPGMPANRATQSKLSAGPLISASPGAAPAPSPPAPAEPAPAPGALVKRDETLPDKPQGLLQSCLTRLGLAAVVLAAFAAAVWEVASLV